MTPPSASADGKLHPGIQLALNMVILNAFGRGPWLYPACLGLQFAVCIPPSFMLSALHDLLIFPTKYCSPVERQLGLFIPAHPCSPRQMAKLPGLCRRREALLEIKWEETPNLTPAHREEHLSLLTREIREETAYTLIFRSVQSSGRSMNFVVFEKPFSYLTQYHKLTIRPS